MKRKSTGMTSRKEPDRASRRRKDRSRASTEDTDTAGRTLGCWKLIYSGAPLDFFQEKNNTKLTIYKKRNKYVDLRSTFDPLKVAFFRNGE